MTGILEGKVALVTGAGHGIGRGHALELARQGAKVVVNDLGGSQHGEGSGRVAEDVCAIIKARGGEAVPDFGDVGDEAQAGAMVQNAIDSFGRIDIIVNNAGIVRDKAIWNMEADDFDLVMRVHLRGTWLVSRAAARHWREQAKASGGRTYGRIINTTSGAGMKGNFGQSNYATAKAAIIGLTQTLSLELASIGVTANVIGPGAATRLSAGVSGAKVREADDYGEDEFDPVGPHVSAPVVAWLASEDAGYVSGQVIKALFDKIQWMEGWTEISAVKTDNKPWKAEKLGQLLGSRVFKTRAPGLVIGE